MHLAHKRSFVTALFLTGRLLPIFGLLWALLSSTQIYAQGTLVNGVTGYGTIFPIGDSDSWTFSATNGDNIIIRVTRLSQTNSFAPRIRLINPNAVLQDSQSGSLAVEMRAIATNAGTFTIIIDDLYGTSATGTYQIVLAKTGDPVVVAPGDDGGPMTNGVMHVGTITYGDLDLWTFDAVSNQTVIIRMGAINSTNTFLPQLRIFDPSGAYLAGYGAFGTPEFTIHAANTGTFLVVVGDNYGSMTGSGDYRITYAKPGESVVVSAGDEGGPMTNGFTHFGTISTGDLDLWTVDAVSNQTIIVRLATINGTNTFAPQLRLYDPRGNLLSTGYGAGDPAEVVARVTTNGTFLVVAADNNSEKNGTGNYRITCAKTAAAIVTSSGDEGGPMTGAGSYNGVIDLGDLDVWSFAAAAGEKIDLQMSEVVSGSGLNPQIRLYNPDGSSLGSGFDTSTVQIVRTAPTSGYYTVVLGSGGASLTGAGSYTFLVNGLINALRTAPVKVSGTNLIIGGIGGIPGGNVVLTSTTNIVTPANQWIPILTNQFNSFGVFIVTNHINATEPMKFFHVQAPN